ncbi:MAG: hypothetical protein L0177_12930 [Chloroflexi bacterium]|nr:hypothetical protein [Chloroflexota bacterium]
MLKITAPAALVMMQALIDSEIGPDKGLRLIKAEDHRLTLDVDSPCENDRVVRYLGSTLLIVDRGLDDSLGNAVIDLGKGPDGLELVIRRESA